ncbi:MAG: M48 family metalloprotease [Armatimonadota bacterium]
MRYNTNPGNTISRLMAAQTAVLMLLVLSLVSSTAMPVSAASKAKQDDEVKIGTEAAAEVVKESKFIDDATLNARIQVIGTSIAQIANTKEIKATYGNADIYKFNYTFKIVDDKEINAFCLPGGYIYVNKGLLDYVQSDDELAGVIAHEIAHAAHHHAMHLIKTQDKQMMATAIGILLAAGLGAKSNDLGNLAQAAQLLGVAKLSAYGQKAEFDADRTAVNLMAGTTYNPAGMLTFMERLARDEIRKPQITYGIFATHPPATLRAGQIIDEMQKLKLPINRRLVTTYMKVQVKPVQDTTAYSINITNTEVIRVTDTEKEKASLRAERIAEDLGSLLMNGARMHNVKISGDGRSVMLMGKTVVAPANEDAVLAGKSVEQLTQSAAKAIKKALLNELLEQSI